MKNLIISVLAMQVITGLPFWEFSDGDRGYIGIGMVFVLFFAIEALDLAISRHRQAKIIKRKRARYLDEITRRAV